MVQGGVSCVGIGSNLITKEILAAKDWDALAAKVKETLAVVQKVRGKSPDGASVTRRSRAPAAAP